MTILEVLLENKRFKRAGWTGSLNPGSVTGFSLTLEDLQATDWQVEEASTPIKKSVLKIAYQTRIVPELKAGTNANTLFQTLCNDLGVG